MGSGIRLNGHVMRRIVQSSLLSVILSVALAIASVAMGLSHGTSRAYDPEMEAFIAAGGLPADICNDIDSAPHTAAMDCVFCLSACGGVLPDFSQSVCAAPRIFAVRFTAAAENATPRLVRDPSRSLRGPPVIL